MADWTAKEKIIWLTIRRGWRGWGSHPCQQHDRVISSWWRTWLHEAALLARPENSTSQRPECPVTSGTFDRISPVVVHVAASCSGVAEYSSTVEARVNRLSWMFLIHMSAKVTKHSGEGGKIVPTALFSLCGTHKREAKKTAYDTMDSMFGNTRKQNRQTFPWLWWTFMWTITVFSETCNPNVTFS